MGNNIGERRKGAKVMQLDDTAFRVKPPASAGAVLHDHPGFQLLESEEVKLLGIRARAASTSSWCGGAGAWPTCGRG